MFNHSKVRLVLCGLAIFYLSLNAYTQCGQGQFNIEISYQEFCGNISGDGIKIVDSVTQTEIYCIEFPSSNFSEQICVDQGSSFAVYGFDNPGSSWCEGSLSIRALEDGVNNCGVSGTSLLLGDFASGTVYQTALFCNTPISEKDHLIGRILVPEPPEPDFEIQSTLVGCREYIFSISSGQFRSFQWSRDNIFFSETRNPGISLEENGSYEICVLLETEDGCTYEICDTLEVNMDCNACQTSFVYTSESCYQISCSPSLSEFIDNQNYQWFVNDVFFSESENLIFDNGPGEYQVCLTVSDLICSDQYCETIILNENPPLFENCPDTITLVTNETCNQVAYDARLNLGSVYCNRGSNPPNDIVYSRSDGLEINAPYGFGVTRVNAAITDDYGSSTSCSFVVEVLDLIPPICRTQNLTVSLDEDGGVVISTTSLDNGSIDNCTTPTISPENISFNCSNLGENVVSLEFTDGVNSTTCFSTVTLVDDIKPTCILNPEYEFYLDESGNFKITSELLGVQANDNCQVVAINLVGNSEFDCTTIGTYDLVIEVIDQSGNTNTCSSLVNIIDSQIPACTIESLTLSLDANGQAIIDINDIESGILDNCDVTIELSASMFNCATIGQNTVDVSMIDASGNQNVCQIAVIVEDREKPQCSMQDLLIQATDSNGAFVDFDINVSDNCDVSIEYSMPSGEYYECGQYTIDAVVTDAAGNESNCSFLLQVTGCDGCCIAKQEFINGTSQEFEVQTEFISNNCQMTVTFPELNACQYATQIDWGDGTISNFMISSNSDVTHIYSQTGTVNICITYEEFSDAATCFENTFCDEVMLFDDCTFAKSAINAPEEYKLSAFPNPFTDEIKVSLKTKAAQINSYRLIDVSSQSILSGSSISDIIELEHRLNDISYKPGLYILQVRLTNGLLLHQKLLRL